MSTSRSVQLVARVSRNIGEYFDIFDLHMDMFFEINIYTQHDGTVRG